MRGDVRNSSASGANALMRFAAGWTTFRSSRRASRRSASSITICCARQVAPRNEGGSRVIEMRRAQLSFGDGLIAEEVSYLRDHWMAAADRVLADTEIITAVYEALAQRHPESRSRGRKGMAAEIVLRLLVLKYMRNWSYEVLERRSARQSRVSRLHMCGRRQGPRRQDHGSVGDGSGAASARADTRQDRDYSARERSGSRAQNAGGYDGRGDQHSLSDRFEPAGGWGQGADPHHEKDHQNCGRGGN